MVQLLHARCPGCRQALWIPAGWTGQVLRCKECGKLLRPTAAAPPPAPDARPAWQELRLPGREGEAPAEPSAARLGGSLALSQEPRPPVAQPAPLPPVAQPVGPPRSAPMAAPAPAPISLFEDMAGSTPGPAFDNPYINRLRRGRRRRTIVRTLVALVLLVGLGLAGLIWWDDLANGLAGLRERLAGRPVYAGGPAPTNPTAAPTGTATQPEQPIGPAVPPDQPTAPAGTRPTETRPAETQPVATRPSVSKPPPVLAHNYSGRALLIGVRNYLYAQPLNPGYRPHPRIDGTTANDPLGLHTFGEVLTRYMGFQVGELSDAAASNPQPPTRATIELNITEFLKTSRPQDRIILTFVGHAAEIDGKGYLVPIEGELTRAETLIPISWLFEQLARCPARQKLLILDIAHYDPEQGMTRAGVKPLSEKLEKLLQDELPKGVQLWLSCSAGQYSYEFASTIADGSAFMYYVISYCEDLKDLRKPPKQQSERIKKVLARPEFQAGELPLLVFADEINRETTEYIKYRANAVQTPKLFGSAGAGPAPAPNDPPPATVTIHVPPGTDPLADPNLIAGILKELQLGSDPARMVGPESLPPFFAKPLEPYKPDYATEEEFKAMLAQHPFRKAVVEATQTLAKQDQALRMSFLFRGNEEAFAKEILTIQEKPAEVTAHLRNALDKLDAVAKDRDKEPSKRWQAHYDYIYARLVAKIAFTLEYNFVIGNTFRVKRPPIMDPKNNNGWVLASQEELQQRETRELAEKRKEVLERLIKEHPGTPWEILARREQATNLGLKVQEAKVTN